MSDYIPDVQIGFYYSSNVDRSANDHTIYIQSDGHTKFILGVRYKNSERNSLHEIELNADDMIIFGQMLINTGKVAKLIDKRCNKKENTDD